MLSIFLVCFVAVMLFILLMAVGVIGGREPLKGSCGGLNKLGMRDGDCPVCGGNPAKCDNPDKDADQGSGLARDLMKE